MKKVLITGVTGFAGSFLAENLLQSGKYQVSGTYLSDNSLDNVSQIKEKLDLHKVDLNDKRSTETLISATTPDIVFHLAALASAGDSFKDPAGFISNNVAGQVNLFEAVRSVKISPRILVISSAEVYGAVNENDLPIDEDTPIRPVNPYAVSKVAQDFLGLQYHLAYNLPIIRVRPFNHVGARQAPAFVVSAFAKKIADIEKGKMEPVLKVGNLSAKRDFTDVHDTVEGYRLLAEKGEPGDVYNIGSGKSYEIKFILDTLLSFSEKEIKVETDPALLRPIDVPELVCDNSKINKATGWEPKIPIETTLKETLEYWRSQN